MQCFQKELLPTMLCRAPSNVMHAEKRSIRTEIYRLSMVVSDTEGTVSHIFLFFTHRYVYDKLQANPLIFDNQNDF